MLGPYDPYRTSKAFDSINMIAGLSKEGAKEWILKIPILKLKDSERSKLFNPKNKTNVSTEFADRLASMVLANRHLISQAIMYLFEFYCYSGIDPELSPTFNSKMVTDGLPAHAETLQERATDFSLRASSVKHKKQDSKTENPEWGF